MSAMQNDLSLWRREDSAATQSIRSYSAAVGSGRVHALRQIAASISELTVDPVDAYLVSSYQMPGQYLEITVPGTGSAQFAIASPPTRRPPWTFLIGHGAPVADALVRLDRNAIVGLSAAQGPGFPLGRCDGRDLVLVSLGTAVAALNASVEACLEHRARPASMALYMWFGGQETLAVPDRVADWIRAGISVTSGQSYAPATWVGPRGRVEHHIHAPAAPANTIAFISGPATFHAEIALALARFGVPSDQVVSNV